ncbi:hypothetical protein P5673_014153, partial [Acropora cervicornis]
RSDVWHLEVAVLEDPSLRNGISGLVHRNQVQVGLVEMARVGVFGVSVIPAKPLHIAFFITELTNNCLASNMGVSSVEAVVYGIKWAHSMAGLVSCPVSHPLVKSALEGAKRKLALPVRPKEPLSVDTVKAIADFYSSDVPPLGFYGFFRIDEINMI